MIFSHRQIRSLERLGVENHSFYIPAKGLTIFRFVRCLLELRKEIKEFRPDIIHAQYGMIYAFAGAFSNTRPLVITFHGSDVNRIPGEKWYKVLIKKLLSNLAVLRAEQVICVSDAMKSNIWWRNKIIKIIPLGIDLKMFFPVDKAEARKKLMWNEKEKVILFNANNPEVKRLDIALKTITEVRRRIPDARLEILDGKRDNTDLVPFMLNASDCLLICSDSEGSPTMVKEAMACNVPVVGVDVGDIKERLSEVTSSVVVEKDPVILAEAIITIVQTGLRSSGREKLIQDGLTEESVARRIHAVYEVAKKKATGR